MNCEVCQRQLLSGESPESPTAAAAAHVADCAACREWLLRLAQLERAVPYLPVPPSEAARSALMRRILSQKEGPAPEPCERRRRSIAMVLGSWVMDPHASPRRRVAAGLVTGVAAALLLFVIGWVVWYGGNQPNPGPAPKAPVDPLVLELRRLKIDADETTNPSDRVKVMASAAKELRGRAGSRAGSDAELTQLAELYTRVVNEGIMKTVEGLSPEERRSLPASIAAEFEEADTDWRRLSQQTGLSGRAIKALEGAALAARNGKAQLGAQAT